MAAAQSARLYAGVMSGTSLDGADAVVADFSQRKPRTIAFASRPFPQELRRQLLALSEPGRDSLDLAGEVSTGLAEIYAGVVADALRAGNVGADAVAAIGCHGQTVRHRPEKGFTIQLNDPARLAELTGIDVVADFRRRDMAAGGQGAPLVPAFHEAVFRDESRPRAVVNIGGIANITWLPPRGEIAGFDCGPGNVLLDAWIAKHTHAAFDEDGRWASSGKVDHCLLERLLDDPFFDAPPPKSTGRELFNIAWLEGRLAGPHEPADVQSTLTELTARGIVGAIERFCPGAQEIWLAGGGARNAALVGRIRALAGTRAVAPTDELGVPTGQVEALAFAWLAMKCIAREPIDLAPITGSRGPRILGAIYPA